MGGDGQMSKIAKRFDIRTFSQSALPYLESVLEKNHSELEKLADHLTQDVQAGKSLFVFGSGHSALQALELYHRAGGPSYVIPVVGESFMPTAGPTFVRVLERTEGCANVFLKRAQPKSGEMIWIFSYSGINPAVVDLALEAQRMKLFTVAWTGLEHSRAVPSRHSSGKKLFEICDQVIDCGGVVGDAVVSVNSTTSVGPLSTLGGVFLAHSVLTAVNGQLENSGVHCTYTSVNTPEGEKKNKKLEEMARQRDPLLR